jgi:protein ImuB
VAGVVRQTAGPWRTSGEWWASTAWSRDEWDIALDSGGLYRLYCVHAPQRANWFLDGSYD